MEEVNISSTEYICASDPVPANNQYDFVRCVVDVKCLQYNSLVELGRQIKNSNITLAVSVPYKRFNAVIDGHVCFAPPTIFKALILT